MPHVKRRRKVDPETAALPKRSHDLYYLFPGMARGSRRRFLRHLLWSVVIGVLASALLAAILYLVYKP